MKGLRLRVAGGAASYRGAGPQRPEGTATEDMVLGNPLQGAHGLFPKTQTVLSKARDVDFKSTWVNREALPQVQEILEPSVH